MAKPTILIVEDDDSIREGLADALEFNGYAIFQTGQGREGLRMAEQLDIDLALLDLALPGVDGLEILKTIRSTRPTLPVIILTARGSESDRIKGLNLGADDYMVKPFSVKELLARVQAVLRRSPERPTDLREVKFTGGTIDLQRREVRRDGGLRHDISEREVELVRYLASHARRAISREELLARVWRMDPQGVSTRTIDMHIARLREKLEDDAAQPKVILTVRGKGYMFAVDGE
jgi:DNA-binding response OmpR family regulator